MIKGNNSRYLYIAMMIIISFLIIGLINTELDAQSNDDLTNFYSGEMLKANLHNPGSSTIDNLEVKRIIDRVNEKGLVDYAEDLTFGRGVSKFDALGFGEARGSRKILTQESPEHFSVNINHKYYALTDSGALEDEYMQLKSGIRVANHNVVAGIEPNPGETGYIAQSVASNVDEKGEYLNYTGKINNVEGRTRMETDLDDTTSNLEVQGQARVEDKVIVESGGSRTGWWDLARETDDN